MGIRKKEIAPMSLVKTPFISSLQNLVDQGNVLIAALDAALPGMPNSRVRQLLEERVKAFREAMYGPED